MGDLILVLVQGIVNIQNRAAGISEYGIHALFLQAFHNNLCSRQFAHLYRTPFLSIFRFPCPQAGRSGLPDLSRFLNARCLPGAYFLTWSTAPLSADVTREAYRARYPVVTLGSLGCHLAFLAASSSSETRTFSW